MPRKKDEPVSAYDKAVNDFANAKVEESPFDKPPRRHYAAPKRGADRMAKPGAEKKGGPDNG